MPTNEKTRERTEGAAKAVQAMRGDSFSAKRVQDGPKISTTFGVKAESPALPCRDDRLGRERRCGAKAVSLALGDALTNSRRRLTSHRRSLYDNEDHFLSATSSVLHNRGDEF